MKQNLIRFAVALAAIQSKFVHVQSICPVTFNATCASVNKGSGGETYETTVTFKWGDSDNSYTYTDSYAIGELIKINNTHVYNETGIYPAGYTIIFGRGSGACENYTSTSIS